MTLLALMTDNALIMNELAAQAVDCLGGYRCLGQEISGFTAPFRIPPH